MNIFAYWTFSARQTVFRATLALLCLSLFVGTAPVTQAATIPLLGNSTVVPILDIFDPTETLEVQTTLALTPIVPNFSGTATEAVYRRTDNALTWYVQVVNSMNSLDSLHRVTLSNFNDSVISVGYITTGFGSFVNGTVVPTTMDRTSGPDGENTVGAAFVGSGIAPGQTSVILEVKTNRTNYAPGLLSVIDGVTYTGIAHQPADGVPEPASYALFGGGLLVVGLWKRRQQKQSR